MSARRVRTVLAAVGVVAGSAAVICTLLGIWLGDDRWFGTAALAFGVAFLSLPGLAFLEDLP